MDTSLISVLPNLGVGVASVIAIVIITKEFLKALEKSQQALRNLEFSVRQTMTDQLTKNSVVMSESIKVLERVVRHLDGDPH